MISVNPDEFVGQIADKCSTYRYTTSAKHGERSCDFCGTILVWPDKNTAHKENCPIMALWTLICTLSDSVAEKINEINGLEAELVT